MASFRREGARVSVETVEIPDGVDMIMVSGPSDQSLRAIEKGFPDVRIWFDDRTIHVSGPADQVPLVSGILNEITDSARAGSALDPATVGRAVEILRVPAAPTDRAALGVKGKYVRAKTPGQQQYLDALEDYQITFGIGPAGTGKTYLAMAKAVEALLSGKVRRLVLTRPAVEAGENLGYLPGSLTEKINPYLRPLYDALQDLLEDGEMARLMEAGAIEVAPLAYMRGRTLNDAFVILDEAQNTLPAQMKMLLTRLGHGSKLAVTGDVTQVDLGAGQVSGLTQAEEVLRDVAGVKFCYLTSSDVVRTRIVADIVDAYEDWDAAHPKSGGRQGAYRGSGGSNRGGKRGR